MNTVTGQCFKLRTHQTRVKQLLAMVFTLIWQGVASLYIYFLLFSSAPTVGRGLLQYVKAVKI